MADNETRRARARQILEQHSDLPGADFDGDEQTTLVDLLTDLMHYAARREGMDFARAALMAEIHFNAETDEERT